MARLVPLLWLVILLGTALRCIGLATEPLNYDEGATFYFARLPWADLVGPPAVLEPNPPLFYAVEHVMLRLFGDAEWVLRAPSAWAGVACIPLAAAIARRLGGNVAAIATAVLVATSSIAIVTSQDARAYAMLTLALLAALAAELRLVDAYRQPGPVPRWTWLAYATAGTAALYLHNTAFLLLAAINGIAAIAWWCSLHRQRRFALHWAVANLVVAVAWAPWLPTVLDQSLHAQVLSWLTKPSLQTFRYALMNVYAQPYATGLQPGADAVFLVAGAAGLVLYRRNPAALGIALLLVAGVPAASWVISRWRPIMNGKTLMPLVPLFLILVGLAVSRLRRAAVPALLLLAAVQLYAWRNWDTHRPDEAFPEVSATLQAQARPGDVIYLLQPELEILLDYYHWPRDRLTLQAPPVPGLWFRGSTAALVSASPNAPRLWLLSRSSRVRHHALAEAAGRARFDEVFGRGRMRNLELSLFEPE